MARSTYESRLRRKRRIRKKLSGSAERPRLTVFRSARNIYVQVIDDEQGRTLVEASSKSKELIEELSGLKKKDRAKKVGALAARKCLDKGIDQVVFDRSGYVYHGRVAALAEGAREAGLKF